ncbi:phosphotransferase [Roseobacter sp. N2S]|uniref:aminoglycoside phosphotransferase family protein n=1 Tax=Roseobacter sp. N2S TaxID=2663844 RepID=UPI002860DA1D|nr:phosphotransferase [Roseobacter sp. N2S]MDR6265639.1 hypothetical protein [Roseobacter sp. N2S]
MTALGPEQASFVTSAGFAAEGWKALPADASPRRYFRKSVGGQANALLMVTEPDAPDTLAYLDIARHLSALGFSAPHILADRADLGFVLVEDFGDATFTHLLDQGADETALYEQAIDVLAALHSHSCALQIGLPAYDMAPLLDEITLFADWFVPAYFPNVDAADFRQQFTALWRDALHSVAQRREALVLRDFHVDNLMILKQHSGIARCGLLDFQDGLIGAAAYDVASLTQDARRDVSGELETRLLDRYMAQRGPMDRAQFMADFHLLAAQRHTKIAGIFVRLCQRDGKPRYLDHLPRVLRLLDAALTQANLSPISDFMAAALPDWPNAALAKVSPK